MRLRVPYQKIKGALVFCILAFSCHILAISTMPASAAYSVVTEEDTSVEITLQASDEEDALFTVTAPPSQGNLSGSAPDLVYTPSADYAGPDSFTYSVNDGSDIEVSILVTAVNDAPTITTGNFDFTIDEDEEQVITVTATDVDSPYVLFWIVSYPQYGEIVDLTETGPYIAEIIYAPDAEYTGPDSFTFKANDDYADSTIVDVTMNVAPANDPPQGEEEEDYDEYYEDEDYYGDGYYGVPDDNASPTANAQSISVSEDTPMNVTLSGEDSDGDPLTFIMAIEPLHGNLSEFNAYEGTLVYTPTPDYSGPDSFAFQVSDEYLVSEIGTVSIQVVPVNDPPQAFNQNITTAEQKLDVTLKAFDAEGDVLKYSMVTEPAHGILAGIMPDLVYSLIDPSFKGIDNFTFTADDGKAQSSIATISIRLGSYEQLPQPIGGNEGDDGESDFEEGSESGAPRNLGTEESPDLDEEQDQTEMVSDIRGLEVLYSWEYPSEGPYSERTLDLQFLDTTTDLPLAGHVWYDLRILDENDVELVKKTDLVAQDASDVQVIDFPGEGVYHLEVHVKGVLDRSGDSLRQDDFYTGKALGLVVVPEFGSSLLTIMIVVTMAGAVAAFRFLGMRRTWIRGP